MGLFSSGLDFTSFDGLAPSDTSWVSSTTDENAFVASEVSYTQGVEAGTINERGQPAQNPTIGATGGQVYANTQGSAQQSQGFNNFLAGLGVFAGQATQSFLGSGGLVNQQAMAIQQQQAARRQQMLLFAGIAVVAILLYKRRV